jgi:hypothetical protein
MSLAELKEAVDHVTSGNAKLGEVIYGDDGIDMALDIDAVITVAEAAIRFYDALDVDHLDPEYFGSGSDGHQYRGLRDAIRKVRGAR